MVNIDSAYAAFFDAATALFTPIEAQSAALTCAALESRGPKATPVTASLGGDNVVRKPPDKLTTAFPDAGTGATRNCFNAILNIEETIEWFGSGRATGAIYAQLIGPGCPFPNAHTRMGLFWLPSDYQYPHHQHGAEEIYIPIAGAIEFSLSRESYFSGKHGEGVVVPSMAEHALRTRAEPALLLWSWNGDITMERYRFT